MGHALSSRAASRAASATTCLQQFVTASTWDHEVVRANVARGRVAGPAVNAWLGGGGGGGGPLLGWGGRAVAQPPECWGGVSRGAGSSWCWRPPRPRAPPPPPPPPFPRRIAGGVAHPGPATRT